MKNAIYWVEIPVIDFKRAKAFYETVFSIEIKIVPVRGEHYGIFPFDKKFYGAGIALVMGKGYTPSRNGVTIYIDLQTDLEAPLSKISKNGGKVTMEKQLNGTGNGYIAQFIDTEGNKIGLHSSK